MVEYLAIPAWNAPARSVAEWVAALNEAGGSASARRDGSDACWFRDPGLDLEGYALIEGGRPAAIDFELRADDPSRALAVITAAALALGWEIHDEGEDDDPDDGPDADDPPAADAD